MKLNLLERIAVLKVLPQEGNFATLKILNTLKLSLAPSEEEHKEFEIKVIDGNRLTWNIKGMEEKEIEVGEKATDLIVDALKNLDKNNKLTPEYLSIYEKFIK